MLASGLTHKEVANRLRLSVKTVSNTAENLRGRIQARNLADLTRWFYRRYTGQKEDVLLALMHDLTLVAFIAFLVAMAVNTGVTDFFKAAATALRNFFLF